MMEMGASHCVQIQLMTRTALLSCLCSLFSNYNGAMNSKKLIYNKPMIQLAGVESELNQFQGFFSWLHHVEDSQRLKKKADSWIPPADCKQYAASLQSFNCNSNPVVNFLTSVWNHIFKGTQPHVNTIKHLQNYRSLVSLKVKTHQFYIVLLSCQLYATSQKIPVCFDFHSTLKYSYNGTDGQHVPVAILQGVVLFFYFSNVLNFQNPFKNDLLLDSCLHVFGQKLE